MNYLDAIRKEELQPDTYSFCPCVICNSSVGCDSECKTFILFTNTEGKKKRKQIFMNKIRIQEFM